MVTAGVYALSALALVAADLTGRSHPERITDLRTLFAGLMARRATRVAIVLAWGWIGWHFLVAPPQ
ncbi:MAG TPA: DUF6186 family protein [Marmoricola sp.]